MAEYAQDPRVTAYIDALPEWQQDICRLVRDTAHAADPDLQETAKRSVQPYFVLDGNVCALLATKDHVDVFIYDPDVPDPRHIINQGHGNKTAQAIQVGRHDTVGEDALLALLRAVVARNRAGGWRKLQK